MGIIHRGGAEVAEALLPGAMPPGPLRLCGESSPFEGRMVRIREILDPELREKILAALAERRGCSAAAIPDWFELDDADFVDLLNDLKQIDDPDWEQDPRT